MPVALVYSTIRARSDAFTNLKISFVDLPIIVGVPPPGLKFVVTKYVLRN